MEIKLNLKEIPASLAFLQLCEQWGLVFKIDGNLFRVCNKNNNFQYDHLVLDIFSSNYEYLLETLINIKFDLGNHWHAALFDDNYFLDRKYKEQRVNFFVNKPIFHDVDDTNLLYTWVCPGCGKLEYPNV